MCVGQFAEAQYNQYIVDTGCLEVFKENLLGYRKSDLKGIQR